MKRVHAAISIFILIGASIAQGATYYVSSTGNDSNDGSSGSPWLTLAKAVAVVATDAAAGTCGDTIMVVANGSFIAGDVDLPWLPCSATTTIQSSALALFAPVGYRTNPVNDSANYGKIQLTSAVINASAEVHGNASPSYNCTYDAPTVTITNPGVFTVQCAAGLLGGLSNGDQVEFEQLTVSSGGAFPVFLLPTPLIFQQHYYVVNQSGNGAQGATFQVSATSGGSPIQITACDATCQTRTIVGKPVAVTIGTPCTFTSPDAMSKIANNVPVVLAVAGSQSYGTFPTTTPVQIALNTIYYPVNVSGKAFQLATTIGGTGLACSTVGTGMLSVANANVPSNWAFRGLEIAPNGASLLGALLQLGAGTELSIVGMPSNFEVDRVYMHGNDTVAAGRHDTLARCISENGFKIYVHDSVCMGATYSESQAVLGTQSQGAAYINNFFEATTEGTMCGGADPSGGLPCQNHLFVGNFWYKPPLWKISSNTGAASGPCLYDTTDPFRSGGEWYQDTAGGPQNYQCNSSGVWASTGASLPTYNQGFKDMAEHKNGRAFTYVGNLFRYSLVGGQYEVFNNSNESNDSGPGAANDTITIQNNAIYDSWVFITRSSRCLATIYMPCVYLPGTHVTNNNLFVLNPVVCGVGFTTGFASCGYFSNMDAWQIFNAAATLAGDVKTHNTLWAPDGCCSRGVVTAYYGNKSGSLYGLINNALHQNNLIAGDYSGDDFGAGGLSITNYFTNSKFTNNALKGATGNYTSVGVTNTWSLPNTALPANNTAIGFVNGTGTMAGDYSLAITSPYSAANGSATLLSTDGSNLGADVAKVKLATSGALAGTPTWDVMAGLQITPGSTRVAFHYNTIAACTISVFNSPVRIPANQVFTGSDTVVDGNRRELLATGLTASTQYSFRMACGTILIVGAFNTRAAGSGSVNWPLGFSASTVVKYCTNPGMSTGCVTLSTALQPVVPVPSNTPIYWAPTASPGAISLLLTP